MVENERSSSSAGNRVLESGFQYSLKCSNYQSYLAEYIREFINDESMVDVTISAGGECIHAHRLVLCSCSSLFAELLCHLNEEHSTIILTDIAPQDIRSIVEFSYKGKIGVPVENLNNLIEAAHFLKIYGLMEIENLEETEASNEKDVSGKECYTLNENIEYEDNKQIYRKGNINKANEEKKRNYTDSDSNLRYTSKRDYTDEMLKSALDEIRNGSTYFKAAAKHCIPKSTLHMRAKALGIASNRCRNEYTLKDKKQTIEAATIGSNSQQTADIVGTPKTVLRKGIQKEGYRSNRHDRRKNYPPDKREDAVKSLERGEDLTKFENEYKIPKTTLSRDKARLVDEEKLPSTFRKKCKTDGEDHEQLRLEETVTACKSGKMSQDSSPKKSPKKGDSNGNKTVEVIKAEELNKANFEADNPLVVTMEDETICTLCDELLHNGKDNITMIRSRGLQSFINKSQSRKDKKFKLWIGKENMSVHKICRKRYSVLPSTLRKRKRNSSPNGNKTVEVIEAEELNEANFDADNPLVVTMEDETICTLCDELLHNGKDNITKIRSKSLQSFINKSQSRKDKKFKLWIGKENVSFHEICRKRYLALPSTLRKRKRNSLALPLPSSSTPNPLLPSSSTLNVFPDFQFDKYCFFCNKALQSFRKKVCYLQQLRTYENLLKLACTRNDKVSIAVLNRLGSISLEEIKPQYHYACYATFLH